MHYRLLIDVSSVKSTATSIARWQLWQGAEENTVAFGVACFSFFESTKRIELVFKAKFRV